MDENKWRSIHGSKPLAPYESGNIYFTQSDNGKSQYAFYLTETDNLKLSKDVIIKNFSITAGSKITLLGTGATLKWKVENGDLIINIPSLVQTKWKGQYAAVFKISK